ncbi:MAG TPA: hypothetical protein VFM51_00660 [Solirubrobacterales bacterium]|nr:hypothetical protein [Solirubrobacterales bacterium]
MGKSKAEVKAWEARWAIPVAIGGIVGAVLLFASTLADPVSGSGQAELLRSADAHSGGVLASKLMQVLGFLLLTLPLTYLFRAVQARSDRVRGQLIGLVVVAPIFLAISSGLSIGATNEAADEFVAGEAKSTLTKQEANEECVDERKDEGGDFLVDEYDPAKGEAPLRACEDRKLEDDQASNAVGEASLAGAVSGLGLAGAFGFAIALFYTGLWSMRTGVLSRFWGSLAMVAGIALFLGPLFFMVTLVWFVYFGLLVLGVLPGGRPPAWEAGEAVPWETPGEKAAAELEPEGGGQEGDHEPPSEPSDRRKRKQRG